MLLKKRTWENKISVIPGDSDFLFVGTMPILCRIWYYIELLFALFVHIVLIADILDL